jgi:HD superfamily phosphodiesterase
MDMVAIKQLAYVLLGNKNSHPWKEKGNKYYHGERVASLVISLRKLILPEDDSHDDILTVAAWFHDISNGEDNHAEVGAVNAREVLHEYCTKEELDEICTIISVHDDRYHGRDTYSDYIKLQQDADLLDHFGSYDIWMHFIYSSAHDLAFNNVIDWLVDERPKDDEKYLRELNFDISRKIYNEKSDFVKSFAERFRTEGSGQFWNLGTILPN